MTDYPTLTLVGRAIACLQDAEQTAVASDLAAPLATLLEHSPSQAFGLRESALAILDHEHTRVTADPRDKGKP